MIWSEFIAHYFTLSNTVAANYKFIDVMDYVFDLLGDVTLKTNEQIRKTSFAMACSHLLTCNDFRELLDNLENSDCIYHDADNHGNQNRMLFKRCLEMLHENVSKDEPWRITEDFIASLGQKFLMYMIMNTQYLAAN